MRRNHEIFATAMIAIVWVVQPAGAKDVRARFEKAAAVLRELTGSSDHGLRPKDLANADCVVILPSFYRGAEVQGEIFQGGVLLEVSFGRGFITCRDGDVWSAPGAITLEGGSLGVQIGEELDIVILSIDKHMRSNLLSGKFTIGRDALASWGNGKPDPANARSKILLFGSSKRKLTGFDLNRAVLKSDDSVNGRLYHRAIQNSEIVRTGTVTPAVAQPLISKITSLTVLVDQGVGQVVEQRLSHHDP